MEILDDDQEALLASGDGQQSENRLEKPKAAPVRCPRPA